MAISDPVPIHFKLVDKIDLADLVIPRYVATTEDELYINWCFRGDFINVYDPNDLRQVKHVIRIENDHKVIPEAIVACNLSKCVYVLNRLETDDDNLVVRISKDDQQQYNVSPWINGSPTLYKGIALSADGCLILSGTERPDLVIAMYNVDGSLRRQMRFPLDLFHVTRIIPKPSGNMILASFNYDFKKKLTEIDMDGNIVKEYQSSLRAGDVGYADSYGRLLMVSRMNGMELLDSELNPLSVALPKESDNLWERPSHLHYDRFRNEVLVIEFVYCKSASMSVFSFTEDN